MHKWSTAAVETVSVEPDNGSYRTLPDEVRDTMHDLADHKMAAAAYVAGRIFRETERWLRELDVADGLQVRALGRSARYELLVRHRGAVVNLKDVGVGVSQVLPVVVAALFAQPGHIVIVEEPESHLHPLAQAKLAELLATVPDPVPRELDLDSSQLIGPDVLAFGSDDQGHLRAVGVGVGVGWLGPQGLGGGVGCQVHLDAPALPPVQDRILVLAVLAHVFDEEVGVQHQVFGVGVLPGVLAQLEGAARHHAPQVAAGPGSGPVGA